MIRVIRQNEASGSRQRVSCGAAVRAHATGAVTVAMRNAALGVSVHRGPLPPTTIRSQSRGNVVFIGATGGSDTLRFWQSHEGVRGYMNREDRGPADLELAIGGKPLYFLQANARRGEDLIGASGRGRPARGLQAPFIATGGEGDDRLVAGRGISVLAGNLGRDLLLGGPAADALIGGRGRNRMTGAGGADRIDTGDGRGVVSAGAGNDFVDAEEGFGPWGADRIDCGSGRDGVDVDRGDRVRGCEVGVPR